MPGEPDPHATIAALSTEGYFPAAVCWLGTLSGWPLARGAGICIRPRRAAQRDDGRIAGYG